MNASKIAMVSYQQVLFEFYFKNGGWQEKRKEPAQEVLAEHAESFRPGSEEEWLLGLRDQLIGRLSEIIKRHSPLYWFHLYRRFNEGYTLRQGARPMTVALCRETLEAAFAKFGNSKVCDLALEHNTAGEVLNGKYVGIHNSLLDDPKKFIGPESPFGGAAVTRFEATDFIELLQAECLAQEILYACNAYRRLCKGGDLKFYGIEYDVEASPELEQLMRTHDTRAAKPYPYAVTSSAVVWSTDDSVDGYALCPSLNIGRSLDKQTSDYFKVTPVGGSGFAYKLDLLNLHDFYQSSESFEAGFSRLWGVGLAVFVRVLHAICFENQIKCLENPCFAEQLLSQGYRLKTNVKDYVRDISCITGKFLWRDGWKPVPEKDVTKALEALTQDAGFPLQLLQLHLREPRPVLYSLPTEGLLLDYAAISSVLMFCCHVVAGEKEGRKGFDFEDRVLTMFQDSEFDVWSAKRQLVANDESKKEIDLAFHISQFLVICELRCINRSAAYEQGSHQGIRYRKKKMAGLLSEAEEKAKWLNEHRKGRNYAIPPNVKRLIPLAISPFVEYIWSNELYITDDLPRICTPGELRRILSHLKSGGGIPSEAYIEVSPPGDP